MVHYLSSKYQEDKSLTATMTPKRTQDLFSFWAKQENELYMYPDRIMGHSVHANHRHCTQQKIEACGQTVLMDSSCFYTATL